MRMHPAAKPGFAVVLLMFLALGLSVGLPAEDVLETTYDELEAVPYEGTARLSTEEPPMAARTTQDVPSSLRLDPSAPSRSSAAGVHDIDANRCTDSRVSLTLLCTLLC